MEGTSVKKGGNAASTKGRKKKKVKHERRTERNGMQLNIMKLILYLLAFKCHNSINLMSTSMRFAKQIYTNIFIYL